MDTNTKEATEGKKALWSLAGAMLAGLLSVPVYAMHMAERADFLTAVSVGLVFAGASAFVGGSLGFLFGIPRTLQQEGAAPASESNAASQAEAVRTQVGYRANTNLEQISDWLTKILVGVSLTQVSEIRTGLSSLTAFVAQGIGTGPHSQVFVSALLAYSATLGFLFGYLWTRLFMVGALRLADQAAIGDLTDKVQKITQKAETTDRKIEELKKQSERDAAGLNLAYRLLNPSPDLPKVTQEELDAAIGAASRPVRVQIFNQAWQVRGDNWRDPANKHKMELTIPLFRALIKNDVERRYHLNHGQLGFALKDMRTPDFQEAEKELSTAIEIRGPWNEHGWVLYEFNRAICRIMTDPAYAQGQPSEPDRKAMILDDLRVAAHSEGLKKLFASERAIHGWISLNKVTDKDLLSA